jgi:hypothetical protein
MAQGCENRPRAVALQDAEAAQVAADRLHAEMKTKR